MFRVTLVTRVACGLYGVCVVEFIFLIACGRHVLHRANTRDEELLSRYARDSRSIQGGPIYTDDNQLSNAMNA